MTVTPPAPPIAPSSQAGKVIAEAVAIGGTVEAVATVVEQFAPSLGLSSTTNGVIAGAAAVVTLFVRFLSELISPTVTLKSLKKQTAQ